MGRDKDGQRTVPLQDLVYFVRDPCLGVSRHEAAGIHRASRQRCNRMAARGARAAGGQAADHWVLGRDHAGGGGQLLAAFVQ